MKKLLIFLFMFITLSSCIKYKNCEFESLDLEFEGVSMSKNKEPEGYCGYIGEIPASGAKIFITGKGENAKFTYVTFVEINDTYQRQFVDRDSIYNAEWGNVKNNKDYTVSLSINPNNSNKLREFMFRIGWGDEYSKVRINQPPMKAE